MYNSKWLHFSTMNYEREMEMDIIYGNTEEQYIETTLRQIAGSSSNKIKSFAIRTLVVLIFGVLCLSKYNYDIEIYGYLREASSLVIIIYIICGALWVALLPIIWWKIKSILIMKQIEAKKIRFEGDIKLSLQEDNLIITTQYSKIVSPWSNVLNVTIKKGFAILNIREFEGFLIPIEAFETEEESTRFENYINEKIQPPNEDSTTEGKGV